MHIIALKTSSRWNAQHTKLCLKKYMNLLVCSYKDYHVPLLRSIRLWAPFTWQYIQIAMYIYYLIFFTFHLFLNQQKSSFYLPHPFKTALSKVCSSLGIVRCNDFFSASIWFQVYMIDCLESLLFETLYFMESLSSSSLTNLSQYLPLVLLH